MENIEALRSANILIVLDREWTIEFENPVHLLRTNGERITQHGKRWIAYRQDGTPLRGKHRLRLFQHASEAAAALDKDNRRRR